MKVLFGWMDCRLEDGRVKKWRFYVLSYFLLSNLGFYESRELEILTLPLGFSHLNSKRLDSRECHVFKP